MDQILFWLVPAASVLALYFAWYFHCQMMKESEGTPQMIKIAAAVRKGAMSYLRQQYKIVGWVFLGLVILFSIMAYGFGVQNSWVPVAFLTGGFFSGLSGFLGMKTATYASARTANAARTSLNAGLRVAFRSGAVMGLVVVGLGLLDISFWYLLLNAVIPEDVMTPTHKLCIITTTMLTFGMGASTQALFARVGGGIYTKAADVGADLVGKVEAGIPEDDPRNPATIADNVGDNVGDVAGMGADLYESYCGSILATAALGAAAFIHSGDTLMQFKAVIAPMLIAAVGILLSIIGIFSVPVSIRSSPCIRCKSVKRHGCIGLCRIPCGFVGELPCLHGRCRKSSGCVRNYPTDRELCLHSIRSSIRCSPARPIPDNSGSSLVSMSERRGSP